MAPRSTSLTLLACLLGALLPLAGDALAGQGASAGCGLGGRKVCLPQGQRKADDRVSVGGTTGQFHGRLVLTDGQGRTLELGKPGKFRFPRAVQPGHAYDIRVLTHPPTQICTVVNGHGVALGPVDNLQVECRTGRPSPLHAFGGGAEGIAQGVGPASTFVEDAKGRLYTMTSGGDYFDQGVVMRYDPAEHSMELLHHFVGLGPGRVAYKLSLGPDGAMYGVLNTGGLHNLGAIFRISPDGEGLEIVHTFDSREQGAGPSSPLLLAQDGKSFYGVTHSGGANDRGTLYQVGLDGQHRVLHAFGDTHGPDGKEIPASERLFMPQGEIQYDTKGRIVGMANRSAQGNGGVYAYQVDKGVYTMLGQIEDDVELNAEGLMRSRDGSLYGMLSGAAPRSGGRLLVISPKGKIDFWRLQLDNHTYGLQAFRGTLAEASNGLLYGATAEGGDEDAGTIFGIYPSHKYVQVMLSFSRDPTAVGHRADAGVMFARDGRLYASTSAGGENDAGTLFRVD